MKEGHQGVPVEDPLVENFVGKVASLALVACLEDTGDQGGPAGRAARKVDQGALEACVPSSLKRHVNLEDPQTCVEEHLEGSPVRACCYCCDYHFVHCQGWGTSQHSPDLLLQVTCVKQSAGFEGDCYQQREAVLETPSSPPAAADVVRVVAQANKSGAVAHQRPGTHGSHGPIPSPPWLGGIGGPRACLTGSPLSGGIMGVLVGVWAWVGLGGLSVVATAAGSIDQQGSCLARLTERLYYQPYSQHCNKHYTKHHYCTKHVIQGTGTTFTTSNKTL